MPEKTPEQVAEDCLRCMCGVQVIHDWHIGATKESIVAALRAAHDAALEEAARAIRARVAEPYTPHAIYGAGLELAEEIVRKLKEAQP